MRRKYDKKFVIYCWMLFTEKLTKLQKEKSKRETLNKEVLKTMCKTDNIDMTTVILILLDYNDMRKLGMKL